MDAYALASPGAEDADEAPGVPLRPCPRCGVLRVTPCQCAKVKHLTVAQHRALALVASAGSTSVNSHQNSAARSLVVRGLLSRRGIEPVVFSLTGAGHALLREMTS